MSRPKVRRCPRCGRVRAAAEFYWRRSGRLSSYCRSCQRAAARAARQRRRQDLAAVEQLRAVDRARQRRHRAIRGPGPSGGVAA
jgi:recombinational DNA repair protein (RecF pathway)